MARMKSKESGAAILASVTAVEQVVRALAEGRITPPELERARDVRFAPFFGVGHGVDERGTVPYTLQWVEQIIIGRGKPSRWLTVAMLLLEGRERGYVDQYVLDSIRVARPGYGATSLEAGMQMKSREWTSMHGAEIALGTL